MYIIMVLSNSASRSRNMVQTSNQPQAANMGDLFSSVGFGAYGARNRRQRGTGNLTLMKTTAKRGVNNGRNIGQSIVGARSSAWNVLGTSAYSLKVNAASGADKTYTVAETGL